MKSLFPLKAILFVYLVTSHYWASGQQAVNALIGNVVMPPPSVASLGKFTEVQTSLHNGTVDISFPLYTLTEGSLNLPITLRYQTSGITANTTADWVGLGWNLSAGGMVTRTVQGIPDEFNNGFWNTYQLLYSLYSCSQPIPPGTLYERETAAGIVNKSRDGEPDLFSFNLPGYSGKFYFDYINNVRTPVLVPHQEVKISEIVNMSLSESERIRGFKITTPDGTVYWLGEQNGISAHEKIAGNGEHLHTQGWHLMKIESADGKNSINLEYINDNFKHAGSTSWSQTYYILMNHNPTSNGQGVVSNNINNSSSSFVNSVNGKKLLKITSSSATVEFESTSDREDTEYHAGIRGRKLNKIKIKNGNIPQNGTTFCKEYNFTYTYFLAQASSNPYDKRLKLESFSERSCDNSVILSPYQFEYAGNNFFPNAFTTSIDHWGYYNGAPNGTWLIPPTTVQVGPNQQGSPQQITIGQANRQTNEAEMLKGTLNKITYPTGGYVQYVFEANDYCVSQPLQAGEMDDTLLIRNACVSESVISKSITYNGDQEDQELYDIIIDDCLEEDITLSQYSTSDIDLVLIIQLLDSKYKELGRINIDKTHTNRKIQVKISDFTPEIIAAGTYYFRIAPEDELCASYYPSVKINRPTKQVNKSLNSTTEKVGGLRIKEIIQHDGMSHANNVKRSFSYSSSGCSSGKLMYMPKYVFTTGFSPISAYTASGSCPYIYTVCAPMFIKKIKFSSTSMVPLSTWDGYHIMYENVLEVVQNNSGDNFTVIEHEFYAPDPVLYDSNVYPYLSGQYLISGGKNKKSAVSSNNGGGNIEEVLQFNPSYRFSTNYFYRAEWDVVNYSVGQCYPGNPSFNGDYWQLRGYQIRTGNFKVTESRKIIEGVTTQTYIKYDSPNHSFPTSTYYQNSDGKVFRTEYTYNTDYSLNTTIRQDLINRNIIVSPWKVIQKAGGTLANGGETGTIVDGSETEYRYFNLSTGNLQTSQTGAFPRLYAKYRYERTWNSSNQLVGTGSQLLGTITHYDANGYPKTYVAPGWLPESFQWSADGLLIKKTFKNRETQYAYFPGTRMLSNITNIDGQVSYFEYDKLFRLWKIRERNNNVIKEFTYNIKSSTIPHNYVHSKTTFTPVSGSQLSLMEQRSYFDGLGREIQKIDKAYSPNNKDVVNVMSYNFLHTITKEYVPFEANQSSGNFVPSLPSGSKYNEIIYDNLLPATKTISTTPPDWYASSNQYLSNTSTDLVVMDFSLNSFYPINSLYKTKSVDPNGNIRYTFTDKAGRLVLDRRTNSTETQKADTYYLYDDKNRVIKIIPPGILFSDNNSIFSYQYDGKDNTLVRFTPAKGTERFAYDNRNLTTFMQDPELLGNPSNSNYNRWLMTKYNDYGEKTHTGFWQGATPPVDNINTNFTELLTTYEYDDITPIFKGRLKKERTKILDNATTPNWIEKNYSYDQYGRISNVSGNNHINLSVGSEILSIGSYDFADNVILSTRTHKKNSTSTLLIQERNTYDHSGRQIDYYMKIDNHAEQLIRRQVYNERNWIMQKRLGGNTSGTSFLQNVKYSYNTQGWLTNINQQPSADDLFRMTINYDSSVPTLSAGIQKNGNISHLQWQVGSTGQIHGYGFQYDFLDRMTQARYGQWVAGTYANSNLDRYNENMNYDLRGNITSLTRRGLLSGSSSFGIIDQLSFQYNSLHKNRISSISETSNYAKGFKTTQSSGNYSYSLNGNLAVDFHKKVTLSYYHHNMLKQASFFNGNRIDWLYDANGVKLSMVLNTSTNNVKHYCNGIEYAGTGSNFNIEAIYHAEGRLTPNGSGWRNEYKVSDHLGNSRVNFADLNADGIISSSEVLQQNHYYPFGGNMEGISSATQPNPYQYGAKEWHHQFGLELNDFGFRMFDPWTGRFTWVDPLADDPNQVDKSPYAYAWNNPVLLNDPDGRCPHCLAWATRAVSGAIAGAAIDYGMQVAGNMVFGGQDLLSAMTTNISKESIGISAVAGATSGGMAAPANASRTVMAKHFGINLVIDAAESSAKQLVDEKKQGWTIEQTLSDVAMSRVAGELTSGIKGPINTSSSSYVYRNADRTARIAKNDPSSGRLANAASAEAKLKWSNYLNLSTTNMAGEAAENSLQSSANFVRKKGPSSTPPFIPEPSIQQDNTKLVISYPIKSKN